MIPKQASHNEEKRTIKECINALYKIEKDLNGTFVKIHPTDFAALVKILTDRLGVLVARE